MADIPAGVKLPADRKPRQKAPRVEWCEVVMDDDAASVLDEAQRALERARLDLDTTRDTRVVRLIGQGQPREQAEQQVAADDTATLGPLEQRVADARRAVDDATERFVFKALTGRAYRELVEQHQPIEEDHEEVKSNGLGTRAAYHAATFAPALVLACCVEPKLDQAYVDEIFGEGNWNQAEQVLLFQTAMVANTQRRLLPD